MNGDDTTRPCVYCGGYEAQRERIGTTYLYVCGAHDCQLEFDQDCREADRELSDEDYR